MRFDFILVLLLHLSLLVSITGLFESFKTMFGEVIETSPRLKVSPEFVESVDFLHFGVVVSNDRAGHLTSLRVLERLLGRPDSVASEAFIPECEVSLIIHTLFLGRDGVVHGERRVVFHLQVFVLESFEPSLDLKP